ncbi:MAG: DapH/DapD/GlmU-related protein [Bacteroidia bacterium]
MGLGIIPAYFRSINRPEYIRFPLGLLSINWIVQRIFGINREVPYSVHYTNKITGWKYMRFEDASVRANLTVSTGAYIAAFEGTTIEIGAGTIWACNVCIQTVDHVPGDLQKFIRGSVKIGRNCWLGNGVVITAGVELGDNVVVGANAVVTRSFPSNVVIGGVPAKILREIPSAHSGDSSTVNPSV